MELSIITLKTQNINNHSRETSSFETSLIKTSLWHIHDQFVVAQIEKSNEMLHVFVKHFYIEVLINEIGIGLESVTNKSDTYNNHLIINIYFG